MCEDCFSLAVNITKESQILMFIMLNKCIKKLDQDIISNIKKYFILITKYYKHLYFGMIDL